MGDVSAEKNAWIARVLGASLPSGMAGAPSDPELAKLRDSYAKLGPALATAGALSPGIAQAIADGQAAFEEAMATADVAAAREQLFALAALSKRAAPSAEGVRSGLVQFAKLRLDWDGAKNSVSGQLDALREAIEDDDTDEDGPIFVTAVQKLGQILAAFNEGLGDTLDQLANAADQAQRAPLTARASEISDRYLTYLTSSKLVQHVDANPYGIEVAAGATLAMPLNRLKSELAAVG